ncbi:MAG: hypothetical protein H6648_06895 [Caldilineae bacterium]|nr:hypothetical protein [Caldilineae bacterium]
MSVRDADPKRFEPATASPRRLLFLLLLVAGGAAAASRQADGRAVEAAAVAGGRAPAAASRARLQQATATVTPTPAPLPDLSGVWSITRGWQRRCPGCSSPILLTSRWVIEQRGSELRMAQGPRGSLTRDGAGQARLTLEGLEQAGPSTLRFFYASLRVAEDGSGFEGGFDGSERVANPCGESPPVVTCFSTGGWLRATRIEAGSVTPTLAPTGTPAPPTGPIPSPAAATASPTGAASPTPAASATPGPSPTPATRATPGPSATPTTRATPGPSASPQPSVTPSPGWRSTIYLPSLAG